MNPPVPPWLGMEGRIRRQPYFWWGLALFAVKHNLDRYLASALFGQEWQLWSYVSPLRVPTGWNAYEFYGLLLLISLPFIAVGTFLTMRRLRDAGLRPGLVALIFVPYLKILFFMLLCLVPSREDRILSPRWPTGRNPWMPTSAFGSALLGILSSAILALAFVGLGTKLLGDYGWSLFVGIPFLQGLVTVLIASRNAALGRGQAIGVANLSILLSGVLILAVAFEGLICLAMALPIALPLASLGGYVGYTIQRSRGPALRPTHIGGLVLVLPILMTVEGAGRPEPPLYAVTTGVDVSAPPSAVWKHVVEFSELPEPTEWLFRSGIAYPVRARIYGRGAGATRFCEFSTGPFVEPIRTWDEPRLLAFAVTRNPAPMEEWTPYRRIEPAHLRNFMVSEAGEFRLSELEGGATRLEGTTWYRHSLWPASYWKLWSDFIIHCIHRRVLEHIRTEAEEGA
jgi:uncharacterized membrane protein YhaH (DUF805 family)